MLANLLEDLIDGVGATGGPRQDLVNAQEELHHRFHGDIAVCLLHLLVPVEWVGTGYAGNAMVLKQSRNYKEVAIHKGSVAAVIMRNNTTSHNNKTMVVIATKQKPMVVIETKQKQGN